MAINLIKRSGVKMELEKKLLMLGSTGRGTKELLLEANKRGIYTIITDNLSIEQSPTKKYADECWMISTSEIDLLEKKCREYNITAIMNGISTYNISVAMELCKRLALPCYATPDSWNYTIDKRAFKDLCISCNVPVAQDYYISKNPTEKELKKIVYPVVVKAIDQSANRGMSYCNNKDELLVACEYARSMSSSDTVIVERKLEGREYTAWYALAAGEVSLVNFASMYNQPGYPSNCYSVTTTHTNKLDKYLNEIDPNFKKALKQAGCKEGLAWIEMMLDKDGHFYVLETGYRMSGDMMARVHKHVSCFDTYAWLVDIASGKKHRAIDLPRTQEKEPRRCGCSYILWSEQEGVISKIEGLKEIASIPNININIDGNLTVGNKVMKHQYLYVITFDTDDTYEMCDIIKKINETVKIFDENNEDIIIRYTDFCSLNEGEQIIY